MVSAAQLIAIRDAAGPVAVGLPLNELLMSRWSREDATAYFESGGLFAPASWEPNGYRAPKSEWKSTGSFASSPKAAAPAPPISIPVQPKPPEGNWSGAPLLVCWHGAGNDRAMSQQLLAPLLSEAAKAGITEQLVLFNPHEYSTLTMWSEYINRMLRDIDARSKDSPLLLVGFSSGTAPAFAVAHRLGKRVLQVCVVGMRPVFNVSEQAPAHAEEVFGVPSPAEFKALTDEVSSRGSRAPGCPRSNPFAASRQISGRPACRPSSPSSASCMACGTILGTRRIGPAPLAPPHLRSAFHWWLWRVARKSPRASVPRRWQDGRR